MSKYRVYGTRSGEEILLATCATEAIAMAAIRGCDGWENVRYESTDRRSYKLVSCTVHNTSGVEVRIAVKADKQSSEQDNMADACGDLHGVVVAVIDADGKRCQGL